MWRRLLILTGIAALAAYFLRRQADRPAPVPGADPADALRQKLDEVRAAEAALADDSPVTDLDARRREVHDRARATVDEMGRSGPDA